MYSDSVKQWNVFVGCKYDCLYCRKSFQAQMKRQKPMIDKNGKKRGCQKCYDYEPHFHEERLNDKLPKTSGDEFIWVGSSGDIAFIRYPDMIKILNKIEEYPNRTFFFQTKDPTVYYNYIFPKNIMLGITLESNISYKTITDAPTPYYRYISFLRLDHPRKVITIEPILDFNLSIFIFWIRDVNPERVYIGYDTKKCNLPEPSLRKTKILIEELKEFTKIKLKHMKND